MILQKRVKGGVLLYALLMLSVFSLLLQFYLRSQVAHHRNHLALRNSSQAYLMAELTMDYVAEQLHASKQAKKAEAPTDGVIATGTPRQMSSDVQPQPNHSQPQNKKMEPPQPIKGRIRFTSGEAQYLQMDKDIHVCVTLQDGKVYRYSFPLSGEMP